MRALLIDNQTLFVQSLRHLLEYQMPGLECQCAASIAEGLVQSGSFDFIALDYHLPDSHGLQGLKRLSNVYGGTPIIVMTGAKEFDLEREVIAAGAKGFIAKDADAQAMMTALTTILAGDVYQSPSQAQTPPPSNPHFGGQISTLTPRQQECMVWISEGMSNKAIARKLNVGESTIKSHVADSFKALGVRSRAEAASLLAQLKAKAFFRRAPMRDPLPTDWAS